MIPLFVLPFTLLVVLASSTSGDQHFYEIVTLFRPPLHQDWGRARTACNRSARDDKEPAFRALVFGLALCFGKSINLT
jgi:hypothetical protein